MMLRLTKILLLFAVAVFYSLVVFDNLVDYGSNYEFVRHVLMMDSTFPANHLMWRSLAQPFWHRLFYHSIIAWEAATMVLAWWGGWSMARAFRRPRLEFEGAKGVAIAALGLGLLMWLVAFLAIGGEWFEMWQSKTWNGQDAAFRMFTVLGIILLLVAQPEGETRP